MTQRIFTGMQNGNMTIRVSPAGVDAGDRTRPMVFSSDNDYLKVHQRSSPGGETMVNVEGGLTYKGYAYYTSFPDLGYKPLVWYAIVVDSAAGISNRVIYPNDNAAATAGYPNQVAAAVTNNGLWVAASGQTYNQTLKVRYIIFKNRLV